MTTPAQDAPLVFPSVAFRPVRLFFINVGLAAVAMLVAGVFGHLTVGMFLGLGLLLGLLNALLVRRSAESITAKEHPLKRSMALNSASRLAIITILGLIIAYIFRPAGLGVVFGLAFFQVLLVATTALPVLKKLRTATEEPVATYSSNGQTGDRKEGAPAMTETILAAQIEVGEHHTATWLGMTVNTDTVLSTAIAGLIVIALAFYLRAKVTSTDVPGGVQLFLRRSPFRCAIRSKAPSGCGSHPSCCRWR